MHPAKDPPIVAIGASAGGVSALQAFFEELPSDTGAVFIVLIPLDPHPGSEVATMVGAQTSMPVQMIEGPPLKLLANTVYLAPANHRLLIADHQISARVLDETGEPHAPIDLFFRSLAQHVDTGLAVVLSGTGTGGAGGIRAIAEAGGNALVQPPSNAEDTPLPPSAIAPPTADFVLPLRDLVPRLVQLLAKHG